LSTGLAARTPSDIPVCVAVNVASAAIQVSFAGLDAGGTVLNTGSELIQPGHSVGIGAGAAAGNTGVRCQFSFTGFADDVRANMDIEFPFNGGSRLVLDAR